MPITIREITSEVVLGPEPGTEPGSEPQLSENEEVIDGVVRRAVERVLAHLRLEWDR